MSGLADAIVRLLAAVFGRRDKQSDEASAFRLELREDAKALREELAKVQREYSVLLAAHAKLTADFITLNARYAHLEAEIHELRERLLRRAESILLLVDDQAGVRVVLDRVFTTDGYHVMAAAGGYDALSILNVVTPKAIVLDIMMSGMNGFEFRRRLLEDPRTANIPVVVLTGAVLSDAQVRELSVDAVIYKPGDMETLLASVRRVCKRGVAA